MEFLLLFVIFQNSTFNKVYSYKTILMGQILKYAFLSLFHNVSWCYMLLQELRIITVMTRKITCP